jgi:pumilio family protein 6
VVDDLAELCGDKFGRLVVLYILAPRHPRYLHPAHIATLQQGDANPFSKKAMDARRKEVREGVSGALLTAVAAHPEWALEGKTAQVVEEALVHAEGVCAVPARTLPPSPPRAPDPRSPGHASDARHRF